MENYNILFDSIFKRKSVRKYKSSKLTQEMLEQINDFIKQIIPLYEEIKVDFVIVSDNELISSHQNKAPHYIYAYSEEKHGSAENIGFLMQQISLFLTSNGLGSCWLGSGSPKKEYKTQSGLEYQVMLSFGLPDEDVFRDNMKLFKRKTLEQITEIDNIVFLMEAVRLAPSAINTQPWHFSGTANNIIVSRKLPNPISGLVLNKVNKFDMGIALCHLWLSALHFNKKINFEYNLSDEKRMPKSSEYTMSIHCD